MNAFQKDAANRPLGIGRHTGMLVLIWSAILLASLLWNIHLEKQEIQSSARIQARIAHQKDVIYCRWNAGHGGVYVPVIESTEPDPYLDVPEREITTPSGR